MTRATITRIVTRIAYARNGNAHNPTKYHAWAIAVDGKPEGQASTLAKAKAILRDDYGVTEFEIVRPDAAKVVVAEILAEVPAVEGVTLTVSGDRYAMQGPTGGHSLAIDVTDRARLLAHWQGFLANTLRARYTIEREVNADSSFVRFVVLDNGRGILSCQTRAAAQAHVDHLVAQAEADAAEDAREAAMHREYQEGWDAFYERSGAVCPYAGGVCAKAWDEGYMAAARNARENRALGV